MSGVPFSAPIEPTGDFPVLDSQHTKGGHHEAATDVERNAIGLEWRREGMLCSVVASAENDGEPATYKLVGGITNTSWVLFQAGAGAGGSGNPNLGGSVLVVANLAALTAAVIDPGTETGKLAYVASVRAYYSYMTNCGLLTLDGITIVASSSGGSTAWCRLDIGSAYWQQQATWFIHPTLGSDENEGDTALVPLKTHREFARRLAGKRTQSMDMTVTFMADMPVSDPITLRIEMANSARILYYGTATTEYTGSITALTARNRATNQPWLVTDSAVGDWTPHLNKRLYNPTTGCYAWVNKVISPTQIRTSEWLMWNNGGFYTDWVTPAVGNTIQVQRLTQVVLGDIIALGAVTYEGAGYITGIKFIDLHFLNEPPGQVSQIQTAINLVFLQCRFDGRLWITRGGIFCMNHCCMVTGLHISTGFVQAMGGVFRGGYGIYTDGGATLQIDFDAMINGFGLYCEAGSDVEAGFVACFDVSAQPGYHNGSGVVVKGGATFFNNDTFYGGGHIWGSGNAGYGFQLDANASAVIGFNATTPTVTGTGGNFAMGASTQTTSRAFDDATGAYTTARANTWANFAATVASGGFGGAAHNVQNNAHICRGYIGG